MGDDRLLRLAGARGEHRHIVRLLRYVYGLLRLGYGSYLIHLDKRGVGDPAIYSPANAVNPRDEQVVAD